MKIALILMIKDETELIEDWLSYHATLFGGSSLFIFDNGSKNKKTLELLANWSKVVAEINYDYAQPSDYENKPNIYLNKMKELEGIGFELFFPMDCDEFIALDINGEVSIDQDLIIKELSNYKGINCILRIKYALDNLAMVDFNYIKSVEQKKCFFFAGMCNKSDHGFHESASNDPKSVRVTTNIIYFHYHYRLYDDYINSAKDKLNPWIKDYQVKTLIEYKKDKKPGWHLINRLLSEPHEYYRDQLIRYERNLKIDVDSFKKFMVTRNLLIRERKKEPATFIDKGWRIYIDEMVWLGDYINIRGWIFNNNEVLKNINIQINEYMVNNVEFTKHNRVDVFNNIVGAQLECGFSIENIKLSRKNELNKLNIIFVGNNSESEEVMSLLPYL